jgi:inositol 2-dehydrogenase
MRAKIAVWGVGRIGIVHARNVASSEEAELVAIVDPIRPLAEKAAKRFGVPAYSSPSEMLREESVNGVIIATPTKLHAQHVRLASNAGIPVFLEKPIALDLKGADSIVSVVKRSGVKFMMGFMRRWDASYQKAKNSIVTGSIGKPILVKTCARDPSPPPEDYIKHSGGIFVDQCIHDIDIALWMMNSNVKAVSATGKTLVYAQFAKYGDYDNAVAVLEFESGGLGIIEGSRTSKYGYDLRTEVLGSRGAVSIGNLKNDSTELWTGQGNMKGRYPWFLERFDEAYRNEAGGFCNYILNGGKSPISVVEGRAALQVAIAARTSAKTNRIVSIPS